MNNIIYIPTKEDTNITGYWLDKEGNKHVDYIKEYKPKGEVDFELKLQELFNKKEKGVFVKGKKKAFIFYPCGSYDELNHIIKFDEVEISEKYINELLGQHGGIRVHEKEDKFTIEIWK